MNCSGERKKPQENKYQLFHSPPHKIKNQNKTKQKVLCFKAMFPLEIYPKVAGTDGITEIFIVIAAYFGKDGNIPHCVLAWDKAESIEPGVVGLIL